MARKVAISAGVDANDFLLYDLKVDSQMLELLRDEFSKMLDEKDFHITSFQESRGLAGVQGLNGKVCSLL